MRMSENRIAASSCGKPLERLERDLGRGFAVVDEIEEAALLARRSCAIFRQVAACLTHHPHRRRDQSLTAEDGEQGLVRLRSRTFGRLGEPPSSLLYIYLEED